MPNTYFQFKQFTVHQQRSAMKVTTDACIFGAWANRYIQTNFKEYTSGLDIGAGTGLLSLILAQDTHLVIDAVEIDASAASECEQNFKESPFADRLTVHPIRIEDFPSSYEMYDVIICNPPFFKSSLHSPDASITLARHEQSFSVSYLLEQILTRLKPNGKAFILMPFERDSEIRNLIQQHHLHLQHTVQLKHTENHKAFRTIYVIGKKAAAQNESSFIIRDNLQAYTPEMKALMQPFYLNVEA